MKTSSRGLEIKAKRKQIRMKIRIRNDKSYDITWRIYCTLQMYLYIYMHNAHCAKNNVETARVERYFLLCLVRRTRKGVECKDFQSNFSRCTRGSRGIYLFPLWTSKNRNFFPQKNVKLKNFCHKMIELTSWPKKIISMFFFFFFKPWY